MPRVALEALFEPVAWLGPVDTALQLVMGFLWGALAGIAYLHAPPRLGLPLCFLCVAGGVYRAAVAVNYLFYAPANMGFQFTPAAAIVNLLLLSGLAWALVECAKRAAA